MQHPVKNIIAALIALCLIPLASKAQPKAVDLGLSVKWASYNVGAISPGDYGTYYAWGEINTKSDFDWPTYRWCDGDKESITKYNVERGYGRVDNKTRLNLSDDVARQKWGGRWRIPTDTEWKELRNQCIWTWTSEIGHEGYKVTSRKNGNSIFLPAAGYVTGTSSFPGGYGRYWSSSLDTDYPFRAWTTYFHSGKIGGTGDSRYLGFSVRPVCE